MSFPSLFKCINIVQNNKTQNNNMKKTQQFMRFKQMFIRLPFPARILKIHGINK